MDHLLDGYQGAWRRNRLASYEARFPDRRAGSVRNAAAFLRAFGFRGSWGRGAFAV
ncbi:MAG: hypothetical protein ACREL3_07170 [Gemmatimonadales bacterium]